MGFRIEQFYKSIEDAQAVLEASRSSFEDLREVEEFLSDVSAALSSDDALDVGVRERIIRNVDSARTDLDGRRASVLDRLANCASNLHILDRQLSNSLENTRSVRAALEDDSLEGVAREMTDRLARSEEEVSTVREELLDSAREIGDLMGRFSQESALPMVNSEGERRRIALDYLTDGAEALQGLSEYLLSDGRDDLRSAQLMNGIPVTGDVRLDDALQSYVAERTAFAHMGSQLVDTRFNDMAERLESIGELNDVGESGIQGFLSVAVGLSLLANRSRYSDRRRNDL